MFVGGHGILITQHDFGSFAVSVSTDVNHPGFDGDIDCPEG